MKKNPLYVLVDADNVAHDTADSLVVARQRVAQAAQGAIAALSIKLWTDHKGDKSLVL